MSNRGPAERPAATEISRMHTPSPRLARRPLTAAFAAIAIALSGLAAAPAAHAADASTVEVEGQAVPTSAKVAGAELPLNGVGVRAYSFYKMYVAALYLEKKTRVGAEAAGAPGAKRVQLRILLTVPGSSGYLADAFTGGIKKRTTPAAFAAMKDRVDTFDKMVRGLDVKKGDVVDLDFVPDSGLVVTLNGKPVGAAIPGADLYTAMLKIWVGDDAKDQPLRAAMLGG
jgi:hypothetical protein